jgi:hypothetical protein
VRSKKDELRTGYEKQKNESGCKGCKATARLSNQEHRKEDSLLNFLLLSPFFTAGLQNPSGFGKTADHYL